MQGLLENGVDNLVARTRLSPDVCLHLPAPSAKFVVVQDRLEAKGIIKDRETVLPHSLHPLLFCVVCTAAATQKTLSPAIATNAATLNKQLP